MKTNKNIMNALVAFFLVIIEKVQNDKNLLLIANLLVWSSGLPKGLCEIKTF